MVGMNIRASSYFVILLLAACNGRNPKLSSVKVLPQSQEITKYKIFYQDNRWDYDGQYSPEHWAQLDPQFKFCKIGYNQSPINIQNTAEFTNDDLKFVYQKIQFRKNQAKHNLELIANNRTHLLRGKRKYFVRRILFHRPSEHLLQGNSYSLEMQIMHKSDDEQWLILSYFIKIGEMHQGFESLISKVLLEENEFEIDPNSIIPSTKKEKFFFYDGSFTTPPCEEGVKWYISKLPIYISSEQMERLAKSTIFVQSNARPVQQFHPEIY